MVLEVARRAAQLGHGRLGVVGVGGREVREHRRAVDADPAERVVLGRGVAVPGELLGEEAADAGAAHDLRELAVVAEHVGVPEHLGAAPELLLEEALAVEELAHQRLARGEVAVGLDPRPADREPLAARDPLADARVESGRAVADPRVLLRLRAGEAVVGIALHQPQLGRERAHALAVGLLERPQPGGVDVGVADRGDLVRPRAVAPLEQRRRIARSPVLQKRLSSRSSSPPQAPLRLVHQRRQHAEVARQLPGVAVEARQLAALQAERGRDRLRPLRRRVQLRPAEQAVAGDLDARAQRLAGRRARGEHRVGAAVPGAADQPLRPARRRPTPSPRSWSPRGGRPARPPTPRARLPRRRATTSPRAARAPYPVLHPAPHRPAP